MKSKSLLTLLLIGSLLGACDSSPSPGGDGGSNGGGGGGGDRDGGSNGGGGDGGSGNPSDSGTDPTLDWPAASASLEAEVLALVNQRRAMGGTCGGTSYPAVPALTVDALLTKAARLHTHDMVTRDYFDHENPEGQQPWDRMSALGYEWSSAGENIAAGQTTAAAVMATWMGSPGHCRNILNEDFEEIGIGFSMNTWTQVFGTPQ